MRVLVAGDYCPQYRVADSIENQSYSSVFNEVRKITSDADYSIVNMECPICKGNEKAIVKIGPNLKCSEKGINALKWAGFDCVCLANNHFMDYGTEGVKNTLNYCQKYGMDTVGGGMNLTEASSVLYKKINGIVLAIINCCEHEFSIASNNVAGSNPLNPIKQYYSIKEARNKANYVLMIIHGGHEYFQLPSIRMQEIYRFFIDAGADAVVNHHQHCFSGYEIYKDKPIFYGLGNFCFDKKGKINESWNEGYMVILDFSNNISFSIIPYNQCSQRASVRILDKSIFDDKIAFLNSIITSSEKLSDETKQYNERQSIIYDDIFEPIYNRFYLAFKHRGWFPSLIPRKKLLKSINYIVCESHNDLLSFNIMKKYLRIINKDGN